MNHMIAKKFDKSLLIDWYMVRVLRGNIPEIKLCVIDKSIDLPDIFSMRCLDTLVQHLSFMLRQQKLFLRFRPSCNSAKCVDRVLLVLIQSCRTQVW